MEEGREGKQAVAFEKAPQNFFVNFTRVVATSPGSRKVFAELFSKSDRLLAGIAPPRRAAHIPACKMDQTSPAPETQHQSVTFTEGLALDCGRSLTTLTIAYRCYGTLNDAKSNAILICHALTGDQYVAETNPETGKPGWWDQLVGAGRPVDTDKFFVICTNVLGGCMGTTGPRSPHDEQPHQPWRPVSGWVSATYWSPVRAWQMRMALPATGSSVP